MKIGIDKIRIDGGTQPRIAMSDATAKDYAEHVDSLPPVTLFFDGAAYWLADGFHRFHAHRFAGKNEISADVRTGTQRDAVLYSVGANASHGLRRTNEDKRRAVMTLLQDAEWKGWSDRRIAETCHVHHDTVSEYRKSICRNPTDGATQVRTVERGGKVYQQNTANIGAKLKAADQLPKILPRRESAAPAPAEPDPLDRAREHAKNQNAAIKELRATMATRDAEIESLKGQLAEAHDTARELAESLEAQMKVAEGDQAAAREIKRLNGQIRVLEATRDQFMTQCNEMKKTIAGLRRKLDAKP